MYNFIIITRKIHDLVLLYFITLLITLGGNTSSYSQAYTKYHIDILVNSHKPSNLPWDAFGGAPEILLKIENIIYWNKRCNNVFRCSYDFFSNKSEWHIEVYDRDFSENDIIGLGKCKLGKCKLGGALATITVQQQP